MCGIVGLYSYGTLLGGKEQVQSVISKMLLTIQHRGPDADGLWIDENSRCALGHRRLSIIDTSDAGRQPMGTVDKRWWITFNGEIYNFQDLRARLESVGVYPRGRTDTEVLILGLQQWGTDFIPLIDGMFAFAAFDTLTGELLLARDAFGEKPLYYTELANGAVAFASELQALEVLPGFDNQVSLDAMAEVLMFQYIGSPRSIYRQVHKLQAGQWMKLSTQGKSFGSHYKFSPNPVDAYNRNADDLADELEELMVLSLRRRLIADVPLGAFLSGGVDSSTVCALIRRRLNVPLMTFSMGFEGSGESEHETAREFAHHLGTEHYEKILTPNSSAFLKTVGGLLDEPNGDSSCLPTYLLSEFARQHVTVAISGDGGDELFAGYGRFMSTMQEFSSRSNSDTRSVGDAYYSDRILVASDSYIQKLFGGVPQGLVRHLRLLREQVSQEGLPLHARLRQTDLENYMPGAVLPKMDRMSMRHSLEVRTPFLNKELAGFAERLGDRALYTGNVGKLLLRRVACRYLPAELVNMPKRGFAIPTSQWAPKELWGLTRQMLFSDDSRLLQVFGAGRLEEFIGSENQFTGSVVYRVWGLVMLESWCRHHAVTLPRLPVEARREKILRLDSDSRTLFFRAVAPGSYACVVMEASERSAANAMLERALAQNDLLCLALTRSQTATDAQKSRILDPSVKSLSLSPNTRQDIPWLDGACVMLIDQASLPQLGSSELHILQIHGVREILSLDPYRSDGQIIRLAIRQLKRRLVGWWNRRQHRLRTDRLSANDGHTFTLILPENKKTPESLDLQTNLFARYAVRVGAKQLPPLPVRTKELESVGDGRYYVFGSLLTFTLPHKAKATEDVSINFADGEADEFYTEEIGAPIGGDVLEVQVSAGPDFETSVINFPGTSSSVIFFGSLLFDDLATLKQILADHVNQETSVILLTVTPVARDVLALLPHGVVHDYLNRIQIDDWLMYVPELSTFRVELWPRWSEYGQFPAVLLGQIRKLSPRKLIVVGKSAHKFVERLQISGCMSVVDVLK